MDYYADSAAPGTAPDGSYTVQICQTGTSDTKSTCDSSDSYFKIVGASTIPSITVLSPNGGEQFSDNQIITISTKIQSNKTGSIKIWFIDESNSAIFNVGTVNIIPSNINYTYTVNLNLPELKRMGASVPAPGNMYRAVAEWNSNDGIEKLQDGSDNRFSIVTTSTSNQTLSSVAQTANILQSMRGILEQMLKSLESGQ